MCEPQTDRKTETSSLYLSLSLRKSDNFTDDFSRRLRTNSVDGGDIPKHTVGMYS